MSKCRLITNAMSAGTTKTWIVYNRGTLPNVGNAPPKNVSAATSPTQGIDRAIEYPIPVAVTAYESYGSEYPTNPAINVKPSRTIPIAQFTSRGFRYVPVK